MVAAGLGAGRKTAPVVSENFDGAGTASDPPTDWVCPRGDVELVPEGKVDRCECTRRRELTAEGLVCAKTPSVQGAQWLEDLKDTFPCFKIPKILNKGEFISYGCHNKSPQTGWLKTTEIIFTRLRGPEV